MALQGIWSGTISFSLVAIPVELVKAVATGRVSFRLLHRKDYSPLARMMYCPRHEKIIPPNEIVRGYEIEPDHYIAITDEELESLTPERSRAIEIMEFIDMEEIDPIYYDHPYYLTPLKGGEKSYHLLAEVMRRANKAGLAKFVMAEREHLVAVRSMEGALELITLHYSNEILPQLDLPAEQERTGRGEQDRLAKSIKKMTADFHPEKYADERRRRIMGLLKKKAKKQPPVAAPVLDEAVEAPPDLVAVLEEIMHQVKKGP